MTKRSPVSPAPGPLEDYVRSFDDLFGARAQRHSLRRYLEGLLGAGAEEIIEASNVVLERTGSWAYGRAFGHSELPPPPLEHGTRPYSTNYRNSTFHSS